MYFLWKIGTLLLASCLAVHLYLFYKRKQYSQFPSLPIPWTLFWYKGHMPELVRRVRKNPHRHKGIILCEFVPYDECRMSIVFLYTQCLVLVTDVPVITKLLTDRKVFTKRELFGIFESMSGVRIGGKYSLPGDLGSDIWAAKRRVEDKAFGKGILRDGMEGMNFIGRLFMNNMQKRCDVGEIFDIKPYFLRTTADAITKCGFDWTDEMMENYNQLCIDAIDSANYCMGLTLKDPVGFKIPWTYKDAKREMKKNVLPVRAVVKKYLLENIDEARNKENIIGHIIRAHDVSDELTIDDIVDEFVMFFAGGMDTTAATMSALVWYVVRHPEVYKKIQDEVDSVYGDKDELEFEDLSKLWYLEMAIKESLRLKGPAPVIGKQMAPQVSATVNEWHFPEDTKFTILVDRLHKDSKYWEDPLTFNPERFASGERITPYSFLAFSAGQRNCIGRHFAMIEMKNSLSKLFKNFTITDGNPGENELEMAGNYTAHPLTEVLVKIENRKK